MDGLVCPRFSGLVKLTQKLMTKVQKKKDDAGKNVCPICGCGSHKGNLCQACFMRSFTPIAYSRNIKVVEQNEYFYGTGKNKRWVKKPIENTRTRKPKSYAVEKKIENNFVMSAACHTTFENSSGSVKIIKNDNVRSEDPSVDNGKPVPGLLQPAAAEAVETNINREKSGSLEKEQPAKFDQVELLDESEDPGQEPESVLEPLPKFVPDYWEAAIGDESNNKITERLKILTNHVVKEAQRPFKEIFGDLKSDSGVLSKTKNNPVEDDDQNNKSSSVDSLKDIVNEVQKKALKETQTESSQTYIENHLKSIADIDTHDCGTLNNQMKQKATLELLKVAFKTNMILNSLFYYFKKVVESDTGNSETLSENFQDSELFRMGGLTTANCKLSVDSFFFPSKGSAVLWGYEDAGDQKVEQCDEEKVSSIHNKTDTEESSCAHSTNSEVEVLSKSQATLSMLMNRNQTWVEFAQRNGFQDITGKNGWFGEDEDDYDVYMTGYESEPQYISRPHTSKVEEQEIVDSTKGLESTMSRKLDRACCSEGNCTQPKITRKFNSEHSTLIVRSHSNVVNWGGDSLSELSSEITGVECPSKNEEKDGTESENKAMQYSVYSSLVEVSEEFDPPSKVQSGHSQNSLLDLVFGLNRTCVKPSLLPLPDCQQDLITLSTPSSSREEGLAPNRKRKDAISQTTLSSKHLEQEMNLLHKAFLDQLAHFSVQLVDSCKTFGHSWQTSFLAELVEHFRSACNIISTIIGDSESLAVPSSDRLDELQNISNKISVCLAKLRAHPHSFIGDCTDHDISTLLSSPPGQETSPVINTWV